MHWNIVAQTVLYWKPIIAILNKQLAVVFLMAEWRIQTKFWPSSASETSDENEIFVEFYLTLDILDILVSETLWLGLDLATITD